jgi:hypothetical protein
MEIVIAGKKYPIGKPKAKEWRELSKFMDERKEISSVDYVDKHAEIIAALLNDKEITAGFIIENADLDEIMPAYYALSNHIIGNLNSKLSKIPPNPETPKEQI